MVKEIITRVFKPNTYKINHSGIYTYINYYPIEGSTIVSSVMIPDGGDEKITIKDGTAFITRDAIKYFIERGFTGISNIIEEDENVYRVYCNAFAPNYKNANQPTLLNVTWYYGDLDGTPCLEAIVEL